MPMVEGRHAMFQFLLLAVLHPHCEDAASQSKDLDRLLCHSGSATQRSVPQSERCGVNQCISVAIFVHSLSFLPRRGSPSGSVPVC